MSVRRKPKPPAPTQAELERLDRFCAEFGEQLLAIHSARLRDVIGRRALSTFWVLCKLRWAVTKLRREAER